MHGLKLFMRSDKLPAEMMSTHFFFDRVSLISTNTSEERLASRVETLEKMLSVLCGIK